MNFDFHEIDAIINARSMAIVGASNKAGKLSSAFTASQLAMNFDGPVYLVNPNEKEVMGHRAYPDLHSLPEPPDLVYITIPAHLSMQVLQDCGHLGVKGVVVLASGFKEIGEEGRSLEEEALRLARQGGFRIIGPNCFGFYNPRNRLTILPGPDFSTTPGNIAFLSQSGGFSAQFARLGKSMGLYFSALVSYGNAADLDESDFLRYFAHDPQTGVITGYLEGVKDGKRFLEALREASSRKPVVLWKVGKGETSNRAVLSHTGSLSGSTEIWDAALRQNGVIPISGIEELSDVLLALQHLGRKPGRRLPVSGGGGGLGIYASDLAEEEGLEVPPLQGETLVRMREILKGAGTVIGNPLDIGTPLIPIPMFEASMREAAKNPSTDIVIFDLAINFGYHFGKEEGLMQAAEALIRARNDSGKPLAVVLYSRACDPDNLEPERMLRRMRWKLLESGVAVFPSMPRALRAIALVNR